MASTGNSEEELKVLKEIASSSKLTAERFVERKLFRKAFSHYLLVLKLDPSRKAELKETLASVLFKLGTILEAKQNFSDLFHCYISATKVFPDNEYILDNLGAILLKYEQINEAAHFFRESLNVRPDFLRALRNLENVSNLAVPRWHFRMLNDSKRNRAFRDAITKKVRQGFDTVLDIGTGTGIFSLFALEAGAKNIVACDSSSFMIDIASQVIEENNAGGIRLVNKHSKDLEIPEDAPEKVKLVVTEIVDCGLLGEGILETLIDSWDRLLLKPSGAIIPLGAHVYVVGIECDYIRKKHLFTGDAKLFDSSDCHIYSEEQSYDSECLNRVPNGFKYVTEVYKSAFINFNDGKQMKEILAGKLDENIHLKCLDDGKLDCLVVWFDLYLDEDIVFDTSPKTESSDSWDQAIFPIGINLCTTKSSSVIFRLSYKDGRISFSYVKVQTGDESETDENMFVGKNIFRLSEEMIGMLNSEVYSNFFNETCDVIKNFGESVSILDTCTLPLFGLRFLSKNRDKKCVLKTTRRDRESGSFLRLLAKKLDVEETFQFTEEENWWELDENEKFDIIVVNLIERHGEPMDKIIPFLDSIRSLLKPNGLFIPEKVTIMGQLIESEWLEKMSNVTGDEATLGYKIAKSINYYRVKTHIAFNLNAIEKTARSEPFEMCSVLPGEFTYNIRVPTISDGYVNALAIWYRLKFIENGPEISTLNDGITGHTAILLPKTFATGWIELKITYDNGLLKVEIL